MRRFNHSAANFFIPILKQQCMSNWLSAPANKKYLRLFIPETGWRSYLDQIAEGTKKIEEPGSGILIESAFLNALNSTNLLILTGAGSSFAAKNALDAPQAPGMNDLWTAVESKVGTKIFGEICDIFLPNTLEKNIERLLTLCKLYIELNQIKKDTLVKKISKFVTDAETTILAKVDFVNMTTTLPAHSAIISKVGRRGMRKPRARFFTTNYDLCFEEAARRQRFTIIDGFSHSLEQIYDRSYFDLDIVRREHNSTAPNFIENVFHLYKLHGSIDWRRIGNEIVRSKASSGSPVLIYPRSSKYQEAFDAPYLDMMGALQASLREPDTALIISGFGFNDDHLSRPIFAAIEANMSLRIIICDPAFISVSNSSEEDHTFTGSLNTQNMFLRDFYRLAESGDPRIHLINGRFDDMALALPDLVGETDRERHILRIRALRDESPTQ